MSDQMTLTERVGMAVAAAVLAAMALSLGLDATLSPRYPDFIVGNIAWTDQTKFQDLFAPLLFVGVFFVACVVLRTQFSRLRRGPSGDALAVEFASNLLYWSMPAAVAVMALVAGTFIDNAVLRLSAGGVLLLVLTQCWLRRAPDGLTSGAVSLALFLAFVLALLPLEIGLVIGRAPLGSLGAFDWARYVRLNNILLITLFVLVLATTVVARARLLRLLPYMALIGQAGLSIFYLALYPARLALPDGSLTKYSTTWELKALVLALVGLGIADTLRRFVRHVRSDSTDLNALFSPFALFGLLIAFKFGNTFGPSLSPNDYEFGQTLLGWWSYLHGALPYVDYVSAHGFMEDDLPGLLSVAFYDGTAGTIGDATRLASALLSLVAFVSLFEFSGSLVLAVVSTYFIGGRTAFLFFTPFICLWFSARLRARPRNWLIAWFLTAPIVVFGVPPAGVVIVFASGVLALEACFGLWKQRCQMPRAWVAPAAVAVVLLVLAAVTPIGRMLFGAVEYVLVNGPINQLAYGIPWELSWNADGRKAGLVFEAIRMSWLAAPIFSLLLIYTAIVDRKMRDPALLPAIVALIFMLLLTPYSMGRIDAGDMSRAGLAAVFGWAVLIPVVGWYTSWRIERSVLILLVAAVCALLNYTPLSLQSVKSAIMPMIAMPPMKSGADAGMPNVGRAMVDEAQWGGLIRLKQVIDSRLAPGRGYLDLTSHNARAFYMNRLPTLAVTAPYNMAAIPQQRYDVARLSKNPPSLALFSADNIVYDGYSLGLRIPLLYRFAVDHYTPVWDKGFVLGLSKQTTPAVGDMDVPLQPQNVTDDQWDHGVGRRSPEVLVDAGLPLSAFQNGTSVRLPDGQTRKIVSVAADRHVITLDGPPLAVQQAGYPNALTFALQGAAAAEFRLALLDVSFNTQDLRGAPVAWGRSDQSLSRRMTLVASLAGAPRTLRDLTAEGEVLRVAGVTPALDIDVSSLAIAGHAAGLLRFRFACVDQKTLPRLSVSWRGDAQPTINPATHVDMTAADGVLIVPLDASPRWLTLDRVTHVQIALADPTACGAIRLDDIGLFQRDAVR